MKIESRPLSPLPESRKHNQRYAEGRIANCAAIGPVLVSRTSVFKSGGIDIFRLLQSTWVGLTLTHGNSRRKSAGLWLVKKKKNHTMITWRSRDNIRRDVGRGSRLIAHKSPRPSLFSFEIRDRAMPDAQNTLLNWPQSLFTARGTSSTTTTKKLRLLVPWPHMTTSKKLWHVNSVYLALSDNSNTVDQISQSTHYYRKQRLTAQALRHVQAGWSWLAILSPPFVWLNDLWIFVLQSREDTPSRLNSSAAAMQGWQFLPYAMFTTQFKANRQEEYASSRRLVS